MGATTLKAAILSRMPTIVGALRPERDVALTFDDGPDPEVTPRLLDLLARRRAPATFFLLSEKANRRPDLVRRIAADGHEVALHFDRHDKIPDLPPAVVRRRMKTARASLEAIAGPVRLFRPPFGSQNVASYLMARSVGLQVVGWTASAQDWEEQTPAMAARRATFNLRAGDILLMHDGLELGPGESGSTFDRVRMVELILDTMRGRGLRPSTVGDLVAQGGARTAPWFRP